MFKTANFVTLLCFHNLKLFVRVQRMSRSVTLYLLNLHVLGNLPVERAKDTVCFLQRCGVSLVSSYAVCFLQPGGMSLASSAIIYNIVKVKVTR